MFLKGGLRMDWTGVFELIGAIFVSIGGAGAIIIFLSKFLANMIAERIEMKYQLSFDKELEKYKANLDKYSYMTKTQFDIEMDIYRQLSLGIYEYTVSLNTTISEDYRMDNETSLEQKIIDEEGQFKRMAERGANIQKLLYSNAAFIPKHIYNRYDELIELLTEQFWVYFERLKQYMKGEISQNERVTDAEKEMLETIKEKNNNLNDSLREYLQKIQIVD